MRSFLDKIFFRDNNLAYLSRRIKNLSDEIPIDKIFDAINSYSPESEVRYVGGCIRKILNKESVDDIDLASNLIPEQVCEVLKKNNIKYHETGIEHGTITAVIDEYNFEITSLREDVTTDGRHAKVKFSKNWKKDASRRDFTINSIYSDSEGNLFDPFNGKSDLEAGNIQFIGETEKRIQEDYLRILRYLRFFLNYSKKPHDLEVIRKLKIHIGGVSKLSKERLLGELKKLIKLENLIKLSKDKTSLELVWMIFPELKNINIFSKLTSKKIENLRDNDFIFILALLIIDETDNVDYFMYKYKVSKKDQKRIKIIDNFFKKKINYQSFSEHNMNKIFYYEGMQAVTDILGFRFIKSKKFDHILFELLHKYESKKIPIMPIDANFLMVKYKIPEGKQLGVKLKKIEEEWVNNDFTISDQQVDNIVNS